MNLYINYKSRIWDIQEQFNMHYPFLKLEFFPMQINERVFPKQEMLSSGRFVKNILTQSDKTIINVDQTKTVAEVENDLKRQLGLPVQILRLSGNVWIETTLTDDWTLEKQNREGEQISSHFVKKIPQNNLPETHQNSQKRK
jgi:hypothetical protein